MQIIQVISKKIDRYFRLSPIPKMTAQYKKDTEKRIVALLSNGSIFLQEAKYVTEEDMAVTRKKVFSYTFEGLA